jgi:hypothetical protein
MCHGEALFVAAKSHEPYCRTLEGVLLWNIYQQQTFLAAAYFELYTKKGPLSGAQFVAMRSDP